MLYCDVEKWYFMWIFSMIYLEMLFRRNKYSGCKFGHKSTVVLSVCTGLSVFPIFDRSSWQLFWDLLMNNVKTIGEVSSIHPRRNLVIIKNNSLMWRNLWGLPPGTKYKWSLKHLCIHRYNSARSLVLVLKKVW